MGTSGDQRGDDTTAGEAHDAPPSWTPPGGAPPAPPGPPHDVPPPVAGSDAIALPAAPLPFGPSTASGHQPGSGAVWPSAPPEQPPSAGPPPPPPPTWGAALPTYAAPPPLPGSSAVVGKRRSRAALAILSVTAVLAASTFAIIALSRPDGAGSPEEAVQNLFAALEQEDAIGVMEALPPNERAVLVEPMVATVSELQRVGLLDSFTRDDVPGADIEVTGLTLASTNLGEGITSVRVTGGAITGTVVPDEVPIGSRLRELIEGERGEPVQIESATETESLADAELELVTVEEDGGWHVSLFYTIAEQARGGDTPLPQFGAGLTPIGADSPEDAARQLIQAGVDLDVERAIGYLPPDEMRVLYDYGPLFVDEAREDADEARADGFTSALDRLDVHSEGDGDVRRVTIDHLDAVFADDEESARITHDGSCTAIESTGPDYTGTFVELDEDGGIGGSGGGRTEPTGTSTTRVESCADGTRTVTIDGEETDQDEYGYPSGYGVSGLFLGSGQTSLSEGLTVVERDGRWYVSPVRSVFDSLLSGLGGLDSTGVEELVESLGGGLFGTSSGRRFEEVGEAIDETGPSGTVPYEEDPNDPYVICGSVYDDLFERDDVGDEQMDAADEAFEQCLIDHGEEPYVEPEIFGEPRIVGGHVLVPTGESIAGFDLTGTRVWDGPTCAYGSWASVFAGAAPDTEVASCDDELVGIDGRTGAERWRIQDEMFAERTRVGTTAIVRQNESMIVVNDLATGAELWSRDDVGDASVASDETNVYIGGDNALYAMDLATGEPRWLHPGRTTAVGVAHGAVIARSDQHYLERLDPATGAVVWTGAVDDVALDASDVVAFGSESVILQSTRGERPISAYDVTTGAVLWTRTPADDLTAYADPAGSSVAFTSYESCSIELADQRGGQSSSAPLDIGSGCAESAAIGENHLAIVIWDDGSGEPALVVRPVPGGPDGRPRARRRSAVAQHQLRHHLADLLEGDDGHGHGEAQGELLDAERLGVEEPLHRSPAHREDLERSDGGDRSPELAVAEAVPGEHGGVPRTGVEHVGHLEEHEGRERHRERHVLAPLPLGVDVETEGPGRHEGRAVEDGPETTAGEDRLVLRARRAPHDVG